MCCHQNCRIPKSAAVAELLFVVTIEFYFSATIYLSVLSLVVLLLDEAIPIILLIPCGADPLVVPLCHSVFFSAAFSKGCL